MEERQIYPQKAYLKVAYFESLLIVFCLSFSTIALLMRSCGRDKGLVYCPGWVQSLLKCVVCEGRSEIAMICLIEIEEEENEMGQFLLPGFCALARTMVRIEIERLHTFQK